MKNIRSLFIVYGITLIACTQDASAMRKGRNRYQVTEEPTSTDEAKKSTPDLPKAEEVTTSVKESQRDLLDLAKDVVIPDGSSKGMFCSYGPTYKTAWENALAEFEKSASKAGEAEIARTNYNANRAMAIAETHGSFKTEVILKDTVERTSDLQLPKVESDLDALQKSLRTNRARFAALFDVLQKSAKLPQNARELKQHQALLALEFTHLVTLFGLQIRAFKEQTKTMATTFEALDSQLAKAIADYKAPARPCDLSNIHALVDLALKMTDAKPAAPAKEAAAPTSTATEKTGTEA